MEAHLRSVARALSEASPDFRDAVVYMACVLALRPLRFLEPLMRRICDKFEAQAGAQGNPLTRAQVEEIVFGLAVAATDVFEEERA